MIRKYLREISVGVAYLVLLGLLAFKSPSFFQADNIRQLLVEIVPALVAAVGMTLVIITRQIDISIGSVFSLCAYIAALMAHQGVPVPLAFGTAIGCGALMGALNGLLIATLALPSIVVTLATMVIWQQALAWWKQGAPVASLPAGFHWFGLNQMAGQWIEAIIALLIFLAFATAMRYLAAGRAIYATGSDYEAARLAGIRPKLVTFNVFVLMGILTAAASILNAVIMEKVYPTSGDKLELRVIAAVVVGGVAISGGRGRLIGVLIGVALLGTIGRALIFLHARSEWGATIQGTIILLAVSSDALDRSRR
ncbi:MAG TPA: ABC transporter permease [Tepidisphaeraceae bacterium]|nr:ABC transporter permease [Tepidisphaeraceae bacterium]